MSDDDRARSRIEAALGQLGAELSPPAGWQARVLAEAQRPRRAWWKIAVPALTAAVAAGAVLLVISRPASPTELAFDVKIKDSGPVARGGESAKIGDIVTATAAGGAQHRAVWIYRDDRQLVVACPGAAAGCSTTDDQVIATVKFELPGTYTLVALSSGEPLPVPTDSLDDSLAAAQRAGATMKQERRQVR